jgi:antitoxin MazE
MTTKIQKWGNSLGIRLPKVLIESTAFSLGSEVEVEKKGSEIILKVIKDKKLTLKEMLKGMTRANFEPLVDWGPPVGREIID